MYYLKPLLTLIGLFLCLSCFTQSVDSLLISIAQTDDDSTKAVLYNRTIYALLHNDSDRLLQVYDEGKEVLEKFPKIHTLTLHGIAWAMVRVGKYELVDAYFLQAKALSKDSIHIFGINADIAYSYYSRLHFVKAKKMLLTNIAALERQKEVPHQMLSKSYILLGSVYLEQGFAKEAETIFKKGIEYAKKAKSSIDESVHYINLTITMLRRGLYAKALNYSKKSIDMIENPSASNVTNIDYLVNFAQIYNKLGLLKKSDELIKKAKLLQEQTKDTYIITVLKLEELEKQLNKKNLVASKELIEEISQQLKETRQLLFLPYLKEKQITYDLLNKDTAAAILKIDTLLQLSLSEEIVYYEAKSYLFLSTIYKNTKPSEAIQFSQKALRMANALPNEILIKESYQQLAHLSEMTQQFQEATFYHKHLSSLQDSINLSASGIEVLTILLEQLEKSLEGKYIKPTKNSYWSNTYIWILALFATLAFIFFIILKFRSPKKNTPLQHAVHLTMTSENTSSKHVAQLHPTEQKQTEKSFQSLIDNLSSGQIDWPQFLIEYEQLFPEFMANFRQLPINHTSNTLRHCICLRMNLSLKETAALLNVSISAVKSARNRLKKQMKLESSDSIQNFINKLS